MMEIQEADRRIAGDLALSATREYVCMNICSGIIARARRKHARSSFDGPPRLTHLNPICESDNSLIQIQIQIHLIGTRGSVWRGDFGLFLVRYHMFGIGIA